MSVAKDPGLPAENRLLAALPRNDYERLLPELEPVSLAFKEVLAEPHQPAPYVYFPRSGVVSLVTYMADGEGTEVGIVGREGMPGYMSTMAITSATKMSNSPLKKNSSHPVPPLLDT